MFYFLWMMVTLIHSRAQVSETKNYRLATNILQSA